MQEEIRQRLHNLSEEEYKMFSAKLLPQVNNILGVRIPMLRKIAQQLSKGDWQQYLATAQADFFEEVMLKGMVIGYISCPIAERFVYIKRFVPKINNWSVCDSFCIGLKFTKDYSGQVWDFLDCYFHSERDFDRRFAIVMSLCYYIDERHIKMVLAKLDNISHDGYYVKMAVAWALATCFSKFPAETLSYLQNNQLDDFVYNKSLQKITESLKTDPETKKVIRKMRRK